MLLDFGSDSGVDNYTQQEHTGPYVGHSGTTHEVIVDAEGGNSGSPLLWEANGFVVGIITNSNCQPQFGEGNLGTSFHNISFSSSLRNFHGSATIYVDKISPISTETGHIVAPFDTVTEGINALTGSGILYISPGVYNNETISISDPIKIIPPATGVVSINP